jgi:hypothetical protein
MNPVALPGDQPVFVPGTDDGARRRASAPEREAASRRSLRRLAAAALGGIGGAMFGAALLFAASRTGSGPNTVVLPEVNDNVRYAFHAPPASFAGGVQGVSMLVMPLAGDRGEHLSLVVTPRRVRSGAETDLTFELKAVDLDGAPVEGAAVRGELVALPWMDRAEPSAVTGADGRAEFAFPGLTRAGSYQLRIVEVSLDGQRFVPPADQDTISVPVPGAD